MSSIYGRVLILLIVGIGIVGIATWVSETSEKEYQKYKEKHPDTYNVRILELERFPNENRFTCK